MTSLRPRLRRSLVGALLLAAAAAGPVRADTAPSPDALRPAGDTSPLGDGRLSDEVTLTRWANIEYSAFIHKAPSRQSPSFARLHYRTEDDFPEIYVLLRSYVDSSGYVWVQVRVPMRPNGRTGWVPRSSLGIFHEVDKRLVVNRHTLRATLFRGKRVLWTAPIGVGKHNTPTPAGHFWVRERLRSLAPFYGPYAFGTSGYSVLSDWPGGGVVGIHGTSLPRLVPGRPSHGCVRVRNAAITRLWKLLVLGTPVRII